jgi:hypothetical protein
MNISEVHQAGGGDELNWSCYNVVTPSFVRNMNYSFNVMVLDYKAGRQAPLGGRHATEYEMKCLDCPVSIPVAIERSRTSQFYRISCG